MPKNNSENKRYTKEYKESVLKRLEPPTNETIKSLSDKLQIPRTTIYQWKNSSNKRNNSFENNSKPAGKWSSEDKFHVVLETAMLSEDEIAAYCRRKGLYLRLR